MYSYFATNLMCKPPVAIIEANMSEPHIDELNVHNLNNNYVCTCMIIMVRLSPTHHYRDCTGE